MHGEMRGAYTFLAVKSEGEGPVRKPSQSNIKMHLKGTVSGGLDSNDSGQGQVMCSCEHNNQPSDSTKSEEIFLPAK
jgi:hypothetical protein